MTVLTTSPQPPTAKMLLRSSQSNSLDLPLLLSPRLRPNPIPRRSPLKLKLLLRRPPKLKLLQKLLSLRKRLMYLKLKQVLL